MLFIKCKIFMNFCFVETKQSSLKKSDFSKIQFSSPTDIYSSSSSSDIYRILDSLFFQFDFFLLFVFCVHLLFSCDSISINIYLSQLIIFWLMLLHAQFHNIFQFYLHHFFFCFFFFLSIGIIFIFLFYFMFQIPFSTSAIYLFLSFGALPFLF